MIVLLNGSFGVGKTTVARLLRGAWPGSVLYDPEWAGMLLMRVPRWAGLRGSGSDDFQDIDLWRKSAVAGVRLFRSFARGPVIVPMTFTHHAYFDEVTGGLRRLDPELRVFCLRADLPTVKSRLAGRGTPAHGPGSGWRARRITECASAHRDPHFGEPVDTENLTAREVARHIIARLASDDRGPAEPPLGAAASE
jgi:hypothetical protein